MLCVLFIPTIIVDVDVFDVVDVVEHVSFVVSFASAFVASCFAAVCVFVPVSACVVPIVSAHCVSSPFFHALMNSSSAVATLLLMWLLGSLCGVCSFVGVRRSIWVHWPGARVCVGSSSSL